MALALSSDTKSLLVCDCYRNLGSNIHVVSIESKRVASSFTVRSPAGTAVTPNGREFVSSCTEHIICEYCEDQI